MEKILLDYGQTQVEAVFDGAKSVTYLEPADQPAIADIKAAFYQEAVVRPVGSGRKVLRDGDTIITAATGLQDGLLLEG